MTTYHDALTEYRGDLKEWRERTKTNDDLLKTFPYHEEMLEVTIDALEKAEKWEKAGKNGWIDIRDRTPKTEEIVLVAFRAHPEDAENSSMSMRQDFLADDGRFYFYEDRKIEYWRPMPEPPEGWVRDE